MSPPPSKSALTLGDTWVSPESSEAYSKGQIRSVESDTPEKIRIAFRNLTDTPLTFCWVDDDGEPHHFRKLKPSNSSSDSQIEDDLVCENDHLESTYVGHAFVVAKGEKYCCQESDDDDKHEDDEEDENIISSLLSKITFCHCWGSSKKNRQLQIISAVEKSSSSNALRPHQIIAGYRPRIRTSSRVHIAAISRRRRIVPLKKNDEARNDENTDDGQWEWSLNVCEGKIDDVPLDTSKKEYHPMTLGGWPCRCEPDWDNCGDDKGLNIRKRIECDIKRASEILPPHARNKLLKSTLIWINKSHKYGPAVAPVTGRGMCFHPDEEWLIENGMNTEKHKCVEMYEAKEYISDCDLWEEGGVILHELSHAWHNQHVPDGYDNDDIKRCYTEAMKEGLYDCVCVHGRQGPECRAYACTNPEEYFAELSVAFLGGDDENVEFNKWFPFNRKQLKEHDPRAYEMLKKIWMVDFEK